MNLDTIISALSQIPNHHPRTDPVYKLMEIAVENIIKISDIKLGINANINLEGYGKILFPYHKMGAIDTTNLFGLDELIIFSFYWLNRNKYKRAADIGANLGLHSILMSKCGWIVDAYEPDPLHLKILRNNLHLNNTNNVTLYPCAVSDKNGELEFVRVLGNTTSSHLAGAKSAPYGALERFNVAVLSIDQIMEDVDFIKMDVEGQEAVIIQSTNFKHWENTEMMLEVGSLKNADIIYKHLVKIGVHLFTQKTGWNQVQSLLDMPTNYKEGSLFVTSKSEMNWQM